MCEQNDTNTKKQTAMKTKLKEEQPKGFQPVTIEITFESLDEVRDFYARMNAISISELNCYCGILPKTGCVTDFTLLATIIDKNS